METKTKGFTAVMAQRREPPDALDFFPTPLWSTRALFRHVLPALGIESVDRVWEPACGEGHMASVITEFARKWVLASDIFDYGYGTAPHDFLHYDPLTKPDWVVTNPPFNLACEFTLRALDIALEGVAMLVRTQCPSPNRVIHDRCIQYPCRSMSVVTPIATLMFGAAK